MFIGAGLFLYMVMFSLILGIFFFTIVQLNCENLFDFRHDEGKQDIEFTPDGKRRWTSGKYWNKLTAVAREIIACGEDSGRFVVPDLVALCEVENDSVLYDLTRWTMLRNANYTYVMTCSDDDRGIDVALLSHDFTFRPKMHCSLRVPSVDGMRPTRDILYVKGLVFGKDTMHVFVVHSPSRYGGVRKTRPYRMAVARRLCEAVDSIRGIEADAKIVVAGDFNDTSSDEAVAYIRNHALTDVAESATGSNGAKATYRYKGEWSSIDHIFLSSSLSDKILWTRIVDMPFLIEEDPVYGGVRPKRTFNGFRYCREGYSDHLPLVVRLRAW